MDPTARGKTRRWLAIAGVAVSALASSACFVETERRPRRTVEVEPTQPELAGTLVLRWTIDGRADPNECIKSAATELELSVVDASGREVGAWRSPCEVFSLNVTLKPGNYGATAVLLDAAGRPRTTANRIEPFAIRGNDTLEIPINFSAASFLR